MRIKKIARIEQEIKQLKERQKQLQQKQHECGMWGLAGSVLCLSAQKEMAESTLKK